MGDGNSQGSRILVAWHDEFRARYDSFCVFQAMVERQQARLETQSRTIVRTKGKTQRQSPEGLSPVTLSELLARLPKVGLVQRQV